MTGWGAAADGFSVTSKTTNHICMVRKEVTRKPQRPCRSCSLHIGDVPMRRVAPTDCMCPSLIVGTRHARELNPMPMESVYDCQVRA